MIDQNLFIIRKIVYGSNKNQENHQEYNKFSMENIQCKAKDQLLNIEDTDSDLQYQSFCLLFPSIKKKLKNKLSTRLSSQSSHQYAPSIEKQSSKDFLKNKLKELLQQDPLSPTPQSRRLNTISSLRTIKHCQTISKSSQNYLNHETSPSTQYQKRSILSMHRQNTCTSQKNISQLDFKASSFDKENEKIRRLIKLKMEQRTFQKQQKNFLFNKTIEKVNRLQTLIEQKTKIEDVYEETLLLKIRSKNKDSKIKALKQKIFKNEKGQNKQNCYATASTSLLRKPSQKHYQSRKLRNILF